MLSSCLTALTVILGLGNTLAARVAGVVYVMLREDTASVKLILLWILAAKLGSVAGMLSKS